MKYISSLNKIKNLPLKGRKLAILGSTGSIGTTTLSFVSLHKEIFEIVALAGGENISRLASQAIKFRPPYLAVKREELALELREMLPSDYSPTILSGPKGYRELASLEEADIIISAQVGAAGLSPTIEALSCGKIVALANKESLVLAGGLIRKICKERGGEILPVDSEHNAIFQVIKGQFRDDVSKLILTASGGPFLGKDKEFLKSVTVEMALDHPNWTMGPKITVDSATLMNKGLEIIEAHHLFGMDLDKIEVVIHPESIIHSMVEMIDGSILAQMGEPNMMVPIGYCLSYPYRKNTNSKGINFFSLSKLSFYPPDIKTFPMLSLAVEAIKLGEDYPVVLNASNEVAVAAFLAGKISFLEIVKLNREVLNRHKGTILSSLEDILELDIMARAMAEELLRTFV